MASHMMWVFSQMLADRLGGQPAATQRFWFKWQRRLGDLSGFPWTHWFFSHITDNCWILWILSSPASREELLSCVDTTVAIWFEESDILASHWLQLTSVYFLSMGVYFTAYQESWFYACWGSILLIANYAQENLIMKNSLRKPFC